VYFGSTSHLAFWKTWRNMAACSAVAMDTVTEEDSPTPGCPAGVCVCVCVRASIAVGIQWVVCFSPTTVGEEAPSLGKGKLELLFSAWHHLPRAEPLLRAGQLNPASLVTCFLGSDLLLPLSLVTCLQCTACSTPLPHLPPCY
jgi:hypothetical protein